MDAAWPQFEEARLAVLQAYELLDTSSERAYERLVKHAAESFDVPIALISLIDLNRQWFKAKVGLDISETERSLAFCAHTILQQDVMVVEDATIDARFADNELVTGELGIRFYAGMPLIVPSGAALGSICVIDNKPRKPTEHQLNVLRQLAEHATCLFEMRRLSRQLLDEHQKASQLTKQLKSLQAGSSEAA